MKLKLTFMIELTPVLNQILTEIHKITSNSNMYISTYINSDIHINANTYDVIDTATILQINTMTSLHDRMILRFIDALLDEALTSGAPDHQVTIFKFTSINNFIFN